MFRNEFGYDEAINYKTQNVESALKLLISNDSGIHCYFDNVGGQISEIVVSKMVQNGQIILCGQISQYNKNVPYPPPLSDKMTSDLATKRIKRDRFTVINYENEFEESLQQIGKWMKEGKLKTRENIVDGIENTGKAFVDMMNGKNIGKQIVKVANLDQ
jgi:prostaglandin reductase 2